MQEMQLQTLDFAAIARTDGQDRSKSTAVSDEILSEHSDSTFASVFGGQGDTPKPVVKQAGGDAVMPGVAMAAESGQMMQTSAKDMFDGLAGVSNEGVKPNDDSIEPHDASDDSVEPDSIQFDGGQVNKPMSIQYLAVTSVETHSAIQEGDQLNIACLGPSSESDKDQPFITGVELGAKDGVAQKPTDEIADLSVGATGVGAKSEQKTQNGSGSLSHLNDPESQDGTSQAMTALNHTGGFSTGSAAGQGRSFEVATNKNDSLKSTVANSKILRLEPSTGGAATMSRHETAPLDMNFAPDDTVSDADQITISNAVGKPSVPPETTVHANAKLAISSVLLQAGMTIGQTEVQPNGIPMAKGDEAVLDVDLTGPKVGAEALKITAGQTGIIPNPSGLGKTTLTPLLSEGVPEIVRPIEEPTTATVTPTFAQQNTLQAKEGLDQSVVPNIATQQNSGNPRVGHHADVDTTEKAKDGDGAEITTRATATPGTSTVAPPSLAMSHVTPLTNAEAEELKAGVEGISERLGEHAHVLSAADRVHEATSPASMATKADLPTRVAMQLADAARQLPDRPVEITLSPEELGKVRLSFQLSENGAMHVVIAAERGETLDLLRRNIDSLMSEFRDLGYENSGFSFQSFDQGSQGGDQQKFDSFGGASAENLTAAPPVPSPQLQPVRLSLDATTGMDLRL